MNAKKKYFFHIFLKNVTKPGAPQILTSSPSLPPVPPEILDGRSSASSLVVQENGNITLSCHAMGNPAPTIVWVREDKKPITIDRRKKGMSGIPQIGSNY